MASVTKDPNRDLKKKISKKFDELAVLSPREIREHVGRYRRGFSNNDGLLGNWLQDELGLERVTVKPEKNIDRNTVVTVYYGTDRVELPFCTGTSVQDFLGNRKDSSRPVAGLSLTEDQAILVRAFVDREGGDEVKLVKAALLVGLVNMPAIRSFVRRLKKHPGWHQSMHEAGLYPADIFHAWDNVKKEAKAALKAA